jgi:peptidyl-prolyl cis-trans isomerase C
MFSPPYILNNRKHIFRKMAFREISRIGLLCFILLVALGLAACGPLFGTPATPTSVGPTSTPVPATATPEPAAATVNGERLSVTEFQAQVAEYKTAQTALGKTVDTQTASKAVLEDLIAQMLLAQAASSAGFNLTEADFQSRLAALGTQLGGADKMSAWESDHGYTDATFQVALKRSIEAAWMRDKIITAVPKTADQVHVRQILLYNAGDAQAVLAQLQGGADFDTLAATSPPQAVGLVDTDGELGWFPKGYLLEPKIEEAAFSLQVGQYSGVIQTEAGYHIIKVIERDAKHPLSPDAYLAMQELALKDWITQQRAEAAVVLAP